MTSITSTHFAGWSAILACALACGGRANSDSSAGNVGGAGTVIGGGGTGTGTLTSNVGGTGTLTTGGGGQTASGGGGVGWKYVPQSFDKLDVLLMVDNSLNMGVKQKVLAAALDSFLGRLINPDCVDPDGIAPAQHVMEPGSACPVGLGREFRAIRDIHIGVITSSLGDYGGDLCPEAGPQNLAQNDHAWLLGALPRNAATLGGLAFLTWSGADSDDYGLQLPAKAETLRAHVASATEVGCGVEMGLEAWYRFLVDPAPPTDVTTTNAAANFRGPVDDAILKQRQAFLRPDSLLAIVMLSDENDCSMRDDSYAWVQMTASGGFRAWRGSSACATNPNDPCCYSCMLDFTASAACKALDTTCHQDDASAKLSVALDDVNTRCRQMKKRFGYDFLFPPSRYVNALTLSEICPDQTYGDLDCDCAEAKKKGVACDPRAASKTKNPLYTHFDSNFAPTVPVRMSPADVLLAGIVGVPWQDLARDPAANAALKYRSATELNWDLFAPRPNEDYSVAKLSDPLMIESFQPRAGTHPITGEAVAPPDAGRLTNRINGHEWYTSNKEVQFACIFPLDVQLSSGSLTEMRVCDLIAECGAEDSSDAYRLCQRRFDGCSCTLSAADAQTVSPLDPTVSHSPLCQAPDQSYGSRQYFAGAYPGLRQLQVLRGYFDATYSDNVIVGSICPKDLNFANSQSAGYGYNPFFNAVAAQVRARFQ